MWICRKCDAQHTCIQIYQIFETIYSYSNGLKGNWYVYFLEFAFIISKWNQISTWIRFCVNPLIIMHPLHRRHFSFVRWEMVSIGVDPLNQIQNHLSSEYHLTQLFFHVRFFMESKFSLFHWFFVGWKIQRKNFYLIL